MHVRGSSRKLRGSCTRKRQKMFENAGARKLAEAARKNFAEATSSDMLISVRAAGENLIFF